MALFSSQQLITQSVESPDPSKHSPGGSAKRDRGNLSITGTFVLMATDKCDLLLSR